jgi:flagellar biosynthesis protein FlhF
MKIVRHTAPDMRHALRAIREQLGDQAVILASRRTSAGVEVTAAVDFDAAELIAGSPAELPDTPAPPAATPAVTPAVPRPGAMRALAARETELPVFRRPSEPLAAAAARTERPAPPRAALTAAAAGPLAPTVRPAAPVLPFATELPAPPAGRMIAPAPAEAVHIAPAVAALRPAAPATRPQPQGVASEALDRELKSLRRLLETQLAQLAWSDLTRRAPVHAELLRELTEIGIAQDLAQRVTAQLPERTDLASARRFAVTGLSQYLPVTGERWLETGGRLALIGPTGVGKTTVLAKLAVHWVLRHGATGLALVASDQVRIGAQEQLQALGQLLGCPVYLPESFAALPALVSSLHRHRLVLIDTPGASLRNTDAAERLTVLATSASRLESALVLSAGTQAGALEEAVRRFAPANPACCVLTKLDEAASLGGALSVLIRARLPVAYLSEGQRIPEDLKPARALDLVSAAVRLAKSNGAAADEDLLRRRFAKAAHDTP